ncbi:MAG: TRAP transporter substrate-binding protein [Candidatus Adiutrix sp.]|jgi:tripartite ATP-independent transporter DctP family solute receptor|nr:TRAP transporter substrate-binding protein [Candidatus Adiutrix sp.]
MQKKNALIFMLAALLGASLLALGCSSEPSPPAAGGGGSPAAEKAPDKTYTVRLGDITAPGDVLNVSLEELAKALNERSGGRLKASVYPSGQLGSLRTMTEALQNNTLEIATQSPGGVASFWPVMGALELPYLYESHQEVYEVVDGPIGQELSQKFLEKTGVRILSYWENLFRQTTNNVRPIRVLEDFKGLKLRVPETKTVMETIQSLGANPTPMAFSEVYTGLSQGTIDGQENPFSVVYSAKLYEVQKYLSVTKHVYSPVIIMASEEWYQSLPEDLRKILDEEMAVAQKKARELAEKTDEELKTKLAEMMEVNEVDLTGFREAVQPVYDSLISGAGQEAADYIQRIGEQLGR